ncbi:MAG: hypothetical protein WAV20_24855, partial [Blastocatellia bacterium]
MQRAAKTRRFLIDLSSHRQSADSQSLVSQNASLQDIVLSRLALFSKSRQQVDELAQTLIRLAEHTYSLRDMNKVEEASRILMKLPNAGAQQVG